MQISKDKVVQFHYVLRDESNQNKQLESSREGDPSLYLHGYNSMLRALEKELEGKSAGDSFSISLAALDAYGLKKDNKIQRVPLKHCLINKNTKLKPGMMVHVQTEHGAIPTLVVKVGKFNVDVDTNHPYAGKNLGFDIEVVSVRDATAEELSHGHAHGAGGHQH